MFAISRPARLAGDHLSYLVSASDVEELGRCVDLHIQIDLFHALSLADTKWVRRSSLNTTSRHSAV